MKTFKISSDCHIKICRPLKGRAVLKIPATVFRGTYALSVGFKMKPVRITFPCVKTKTNVDFSVKSVERSSHPSNFFIFICLFEDSLYSKNVYNTMKL